MEINSMNSTLTSDAIERVQRWDRQEGPELVLITAGTALLLLARGQAAVDLFSSVSPIVREQQPEPAPTPEPSPERKPVEVTTGLRGSGVE